MTQQLKVECDKKMEYTLVCEGGNDRQILKEKIERNKFLLGAICSWTHMGLKISRILVDFQEFF